MLGTWKGIHIDMLGHSDSTTRKPHRSIIKLSELVVNREARLAMLLDPRNSQDPTKFDTKLYLLKDVHASSVVHVIFMRRWVQSMKAHAAFLKFVGPSTERNNYYCEITYGENPMNQQIWKGLFCFLRLPPLLPFVTLPSLLFLLSFFPFFFF